MITRNPITSHDRGVNAYAAYKQARQVKLSANQKKKKKKTNYTDRAPDRRMSGSDSSYYRQNKSAPKSGGGTQKRNGNISSGVRETQKKAYNETAGGRFTQGLIRNGMMAGMPSETKATYTDSHDKQRKVSESKAYKAGKIIGDFASYGTGYSLAGKAIARATGKAVAKKAAKELGEKAVKETAEKTAEKTVAKTAGKLAKAEDKVATKAGEKILKTNEKLGNKIAKSKAVKKYAEKKASKASEVAKIAGTAKRKEAIAKDVGAKAADKITKSLIADATAGTVLDTARAKGEGMDIGLNKEYAKYMGSMAAANVVFGAGMEGLGAGAGKLARSQAAKKGAQTVRKLVNGKQKDVKIKNETHVPSTLKGRENAEKVGKIQKDFTEMPTVPKGQKMKDALSPEEIRQRRNVQNRYSEVTKESRARQEARGDYNRSLKKKGVQEERVRQVKDIAPEMPKSADDYVARINTARKYADDNNINFSDVVKEHNGNRAEAINDLVARAEKSKPVKAEAPKEAPTTKRVGYHAGDLGKAEYHHNQAGSQRHTGAYGTGTYFVGDKGAFKTSESYASRPINTVNYENYNLYRPSNAAQGKQVHDDLRVLNRESLNLNKLAKRTSTGDAELENIRKIVNEEATEFTPQNLNRLEELSDDVLSKRQLEQVQKDAREAFESSNERLSDEEARRLAKKEADEFREDMEELGLEISDSEYNNMLNEHFERLKGESGTSEEEFYFNYLSDALNKEVNGDLNGMSNYLDEIGKAKELLPRLAKNLGKSEDEVRRAFDKTVETVSKYGDINPKSKKDSASTVFMKELGYEGVDVTGIKGLDDTEYGSVIYELKPAEQTIAKEEPAQATPKQPSGKPKATGTAKARDVINSDNVSAKRIEGYKDIDKADQKTIREAMSDEKFIEKMKEEDGKWMDKFEEGQSQNGKTDAEMIRDFYKDYDPETNKFVIAEHNVSSAAEKPKFMQKLRSWIGDGVMTFRKEFTDTAEAVWQLSKKYDDLHLYALLDRLRQIGNHSAEMINGEKQTIITKNGTEDIGKSIKGIFEPIINRGNDYYIDFQEFMFNRHNIQRYAKGKPVYGATHTIKDSNKVLADLAEKYGDKGIEEFKKYADDVYKYNKALLRMEYESGLISYETYKRVLDDYPYYVPSYRYDMSDSGVIKDVNQIGTAMFPKAVGSNKNILPLHEQMIHRTRTVCDACAMNEFGIRLMKDMKDHGDLLGKVEQIAEKDIEPDSVTDIAKDTFQKNLEEKDGKFIFNIKENGKVNKVPISKDVFDAVKTLNNPMPKIPVVYQANRVFRGMNTTYQPTFGPVNGIKDFIDAPAFSKNGAKDFVLNYPKAIAMMWNQHPLWQTYKAIGGKGGSFFEIGEEFKNHTWFRRNTLDRLATVQEAIEQAPRFNEFVLTLKNGGNSKENVLQAFHNSKEVTVNFGRYGRVGRVLNSSFIPFFNAAAQDVVRISRALQTGRVMPVLVTSAAFGIAPAAFNELMWGDDEDYQAIRQSDKDTNYLVPIPAMGKGYYVRIPKGRVVSALSMPFERLIRTGLGHGDERGTFEGMGHSIMSQVGPKSPFEDNILTPALEARKENGRTWYGQDIVPERLRNAAYPEDEFDENTTKVARGIGEALHKSPKRIDYLLKQYTGFGGTLLRSNGVTGSETSTPFGAVGTKFITDAVTNNELQTRLYDKKKFYEGKKKHTESDKDDLTYKYITEGTNKMSEYNNQVKDIQADDSLTKAEKLTRIRKIRDEQNKVAKEYLESESKIKTASKDAVKQVDKEAFAEYESNTQYESALKTQMEVNMRGAKAVLAEEDEKIKQHNKEHPDDPKDLLSTKIRNAGLTPEGYYALQARNISLKTYVGAKKHNTDLDKYTDYVKTKSKYKGGFPSHAMELITNGMVKDEKEAEEVYGIKKQSYKMAQFYLDNGYTPEDVYNVTGNVKKITTDIKNNYGHDTWKDGTVVMSKEGLKKYLDSRKNLTQAQRHNLWLVYGWGRQDWINANPY